MQPDPIALVRLSLHQPRAAARHVMDLGLPAGAVWAAFGLAIVVSGTLGWSGFQLPPGMAENVDPLQLRLLGSPMTFVLAQALTVLVLTVGITAGGRLFGGHGRFISALTLVVWLEVMMIALQLAQLLLMFVSEPLALVVALASVGIFLWLLSQFTAELHGFANSWAVLAGIIGGAFLLGIVLATLGLRPPGI